MPKQVKNWSKKGSALQKKAAAVHHGSKKTGKQLNKAIKKTAKKLRQTAARNYKRQTKQKYLKEHQGQLCGYCRDLHSTSDCPALLKKRDLRLSKASTKRAKKIRKKNRNIDRQSNKEEAAARARAPSGNQYRTDCAFCQGNHTSSDCPTLVPLTPSVPGAVPVFDFHAIDSNQAAAR